MLTQFPASNDEGGLNTDSAREFHHMQPKALCETNVVSTTRVCLK